MNRFEEISKHAMEKDIPDKDYTILETHLFIALKDIYKQYFNGKINKNDGSKIKNNLFVTFNKLENEYNFEQKLLKQTYINISKTEELRIKLRKALKENREALETALELISYYSGEKWEVRGKRYE